MKKFLLLIALLFPHLSFAYQCPDFKDFYQDTKNVWHLLNIPAAPEGTFWQPVTQGPLGYTHHVLNTFEVDLLYGTWPNRVTCDYGFNGNIFMGIELHMQPKQMPEPLPGTSFDGDLPNECIVSPENCTFTATNPINEAPVNQ